MENINNAFAENGEAYKGIYVPFSFEYLLDVDENNPGKYLPGTKVF